MPGQNLQAGWEQVPEDGGGRGRVLERPQTASGEAGTTPGKGERGAQAPRAKRATFSTPCQNPQRPSAGARARVLKPRATMPGEGAGAEIGRARRTGMCKYKLMGGRACAHQARRAPGPYLPGARALSHPGTLAIDRPIDCPSRSLPFPPTCRVRAALQPTHAPLSGGPAPREPGAQ